MIVHVCKKSVALLSIKRYLLVWRRKLFCKRVDWQQLRQLQPVSRVFGLDRGTPIDRFYIEQFLNQNSQHIRGEVFEIAETTYSRRFGRNVSEYRMLTYETSGDPSGVVADLTQIETLPADAADCFICTQTLNFIYDFNAAIRGLHHVLKPGGVVLVTVGGIAQISQYDMERWGDYWRFTPLSIRKAFEAEFGAAQVEVCAYGNVLTSVSMLEGISAEELAPEELQYADRDYPVLIAIKAVKANASGGVTPVDVAGCLPTRTMG